MNIEIKKENVFDIIKSAVDKTVDLIKPTYGPANNKVIISKITHGLVVDDGVQIARDLELKNPLENAVLKVVRETAIRTNDRVGDGTTGALIMLQAIINEVAKLGNRSGRSIEKELKEAFEEVKEQLLKSAKPIKTKEDLYKVALVSFDDKEIAKLISDAWDKLGKDGVLTVSRSQTMETLSELTNGIKIPRGYLSPYMITDPNRMEGILEKPYILITDYRLTEVKDIIGIMEKLSAKKILNLVIIAENIEQNALSTLIINKMQGKFNTIAVNASTGQDQLVTLEDIAMMTGARFFSEKKGDKLEEAEIEDLGRATRFTAKKNESVILEPQGNQKDIKKAISDLESAIKLEVDEKNKKELKDRLARFSNKVGVIKVGAATENETKALKYKVEDAINSTQAAYKGGVVSGAGLSLAKIKTKSEILNAALQVPFRQLKNNVGLDNHRELKEDEAINVVTNEIGNYMKVGVLDPVDVIIAQVESAISIASLLITTTGMIVEKPQEMKQE